MKMKLAAILCVVAWMAGAAEIYKADNQDALSAGSSWAGGVAPGVDDVALWDGDIAVTDSWTYGLGTDVAWHGIRVTNVASVMMLTVTNDGHRLMLGAGGLDFSSTIGYNNAVNFYTPLAVTAPQTWALGNNVALYLYGSISGVGPLALTNTSTGGWCAFYEPVNVPEGITIDCTGVYLRTNATFAGPVTLPPGRALRLNRPGAVTWAEVFSGNAVPNNGLFMFGGQPGTVRGTVTLEEGDSLVSATSDSRTNGCVTVQVNDVVQNGGEITANWFDLTGGTFTQAQGTTFVEYGAAIGLGGHVAGAVERDVAIEGGTFEARRITLGVGNTYAYPGMFVVTGGAVKVDANDSLEYGGIAIGAAKGASLEGAATSDPAGVLRMEGGTLSTVQISYGDFNVTRDSSWNVTNGFARFELRGGEVYVGAGGIGPAPAWKQAKSSSETVWSGGTLGAASDFDCRAKVVLSDKHGGVTIQTADTNRVPHRVTMKQPLAGTGSLRKTGEGVLVLEAGCTYTGRTTVTEGTLKVVNLSETAIWRADDLAAAAGATVNTWACSSGSENWSFNSTVATAINSSFTPPQMADELINGHKAVRFNGTTDALALSAVATPTTPVYSNDEERFSVAVVVRPQGAGQGDGPDVRDTAGILGSQNAAWGGGVWTIGMRRDGAAGAGFGADSAAPAWATAWSAGNGLPIGEPHVVIYTWKSDSHVEMNIGGTCYRQAIADSPLVIAKTRIILGSNENGLGFNGDISEMRFYRGVCLSAEEQDQIGAELAATYGATYEPTPSEEAGGGVPPAFAVWNTDNLSGAAGDVVDSWANTTGAWTFNSTVAKAIHAWATPPIISSKTLGGYKTVLFDGNADHLGMTGMAATPASGATNLTVAVVLRPHGRGGSGGQGDWRSSAGVLGQNYRAAEANWGFAMSENGLIGGGVSISSSGYATAWSGRPMFYDTEAHVAIMVWKGGESVSVNVDGTVNTVRNTQDNARYMARIILGSNEAGNCFAGEVAEIRFWQSALTTEQQNALGLELARKYALPEEGFITGGASVTPGALASREVEIAEGATFDAQDGAYRIGAGQVFSGGGRATGGLVVGSGGVLEAGTDGALSIDALSVESGGIFQWHSGANGEHCATTVTGDVVLPQGRVVVSIIDAAGENAAPRGVLLRYGGTLTDNGAAWEIAGGARGVTHVIHDEVNRELWVKTPVGTILFLK